MDGRRQYKRSIVLVASAALVISNLAACVTVTIDERGDPFDELPAWSPNGRNLVHVCYWPNNRDTSGRDIANPYSPVDKWLEICITDLASRHRLRITKDEQYNYDPSWSPDGSYIAFIGKNSLFVSTPDGSEVKKVSLGRQITHYPGQQYSWSPDGLQLCFAANAIGELGSLETDLFLVSLSEMTIRQLTNWSGAELDPRWAPNGDRLAFIWSPKDVQANIAQIHIIDVRSGDSEQIIETFEGASLQQRAISDLAWSPDGKLLAFIGSRNSIRSAVYLVDVNTGQLDRITTEMELLSDLAWSPDGSHLVFVGQDPRDGEGIFSIKFNGTDLKQLTDQRDFDDGSSFYTTRGQRLTWSSDGQVLAFVRNGQNDPEQGIWIIRLDGSSSPEMITGE